IVATTGIRAQRKARRGWRRSHLKPRRLVARICIRPKMDTQAQASEALRDKVARARRRRTLLAGATLLSAAALGGLAWASESSVHAHRPPHRATAAARGAPGAPRRTAPARTRLAATPSANPQDPTGAPAEVRVGGAAGTRVAGDFLGLSFEADVLPDLPRLVQAGTLGRMLGSIGTGTLRFGGRTADREVAWAQPGAPRPGWARNRVSPADLQALASLSPETGREVPLTLNLAHYHPSRA